MSFQSTSNFSDLDFTANKNNHSMEANLMMTESRNNKLREQIKYLNNKAIIFYSEQKFVESLNILKEAEDIYLVDYFIHVIF